MYKIILKKNILVVTILFLTMNIYSLDFVKSVDDNSSFSSKDMSFDVLGNKEYVLISTPKVTKPAEGFPVIIILHGHIPIEKYSTINSYKTVFNNYARSEFVVVKPDLRAHDRSEKGLNYNSRITQVYFKEDILALVAELKSNLDIDAKNIFLMGHSNGGSTTLRLLTTNSNLFNAALLWAPVSVNLEEHGFFYKDDGLINYGLKALEVPQAVLGIEESRNKVVDALKIEGLTLKDVRFLDKLDKITSPIIIKHADTDQEVPYYWSEELVKMFKESGNKSPIELVNYPGDNHNLSKHWPGLFKEDLKWFRDRIKD